MCRLICVVTRFIEREMYVEAATSDLDAIAVTAVCADGSDVGALGNDR